MKERENIVWLTDFRRVHGGTEQGRDDDAVHGVRRARCNGALKSLINRSEEWLSRGCERDKVHFRNGGMGEAFREVECMTECWFHLVSVRALVLFRCHGGYDNQRNCSQ